MIKTIIAVFILLIFQTQLFSKDRSELEKKNKVFLEDIKEIGDFKKINFAPAGMFDPKYNQFEQMARFSQEKIGMIFVKQKGMMDKYPENLMLGMAYFEFFYQDQLKKATKDLQKYENDYPNVKNYTKKTAQKIYGLNKARKSMRSALGFSLDDDIDEVLNSYYTLYKLFSQGEKKTNKLNSSEKKLYKFHNKLAQKIGKIKTLAEDKKEQRIVDKKFDKEFNKIKKKIIKDFNKLSDKENYQLVNNFFNEVLDNKDYDIDILVDSIYVSEFLLNEIKNVEIKKKYEVDLADADFSSFSQTDLEILGKISNSSKTVKIEKIENIQKKIFYLENNNININDTIDELRSNSINLSNLNVNFKPMDEMKLWARRDWANAWINPIPEKITDETKNLMINLTEEDVESIKAQLSIQYFKEIIGKDLVNDFSENFKEIQKELTNNNFEFSYGLDDYARFLGDVFEMDIRNYADLTDLANATYNENWSVEEYASAYQFNVDAINALASGTNAFDVAQVAQNLGATLQDVADTIAAASAAGISVDLEAAAAGLGYDSFAAAVEAYNQQHGTSYTVESAKEALGQ